MGRIAFLVVALGGSLATFSGQAVSAAPVAYTESGGGDLPQLDPLPVFTLDVGVNTISGTITAAPMGGSDFDYFAFVVPAGNVLTSATLTMIDTAEPFTPHITSVTWNLYSGSSSAFGGTGLGAIASANPGSTSLPGLPLPAGTYNVTGPSMNYVGFPAYADYVFSLTVAVPEPATLGLLASAVVPTLLRRRRRRSIA
jgi:hypothetical protein